MKLSYRPARDVQIDTIRGLACLLLVAYHVVGSEPTNGLLLADGPYRLAADLLAYIRMPLFTFLSGYVYAWRPFGGDIHAFLRGKARRLLIPMVVVGSSFVFARSVMPGTNVGDVHWQLLHIYPVEHFWFVESLFWIFLLMIPLERTHLVTTPRRFAVVLGAVSLLYVSHWEFPENYFSVNGVFYLLPFFLGGLGVSRFELRLGRSHLLLLLLGFVLAYVYIGLRISQAGWVLDRRGALALWIGLSSALLLVRSGWRLSTLAQIGVYSYSIYLFHVFFTAASRIFLHNLGLEQRWLLLLVGTLAGVLGPIVLDLISSAHPLSAMLLLGKAIKRKQLRLHPDPIAPQPQPVLE